MAANENWHWRENWRSAIDSAIINQRREGEIAWNTVLGLDVHTVIVNHQRDWATLTFQPYYRMAVETEDFPSIETKNERLTWRIANLNFHLSPQNLFNVKVGHFEIPFGIEFYEDTNGTLRQFTPPVYQQLKADWGVSVNGDVSRWLDQKPFLGFTTYEVALTRGSGNMWKTGNNLNAPFAFSGRIGRPINDNTPLGISWMWANTLNDASGAMDSTTHRRQLGIDGGYHSGLWGALWELGYGDRELQASMINEQQFGYLFGELQKRTPSETLLIYAQWFADWAKVTQPLLNSNDIAELEQEKHRLTIGVKQYATRDVTLSAQGSYWLAGAPTEDRFFMDLQFRVRW